MRNRAFIYDRGATASGIVGEVQSPTLVDWARERDETSEARVIARTSRCSQLIQQDNVGRYEMVVERDGRRQWEGPITYLNTEGGLTDIRARDISHYLNRTALTRRWDNSKAAVYAVDRLRSIIEHECARKEQLGYRILEGLKVIETVDGARTMRITKPYEKYVYEELDDLAWRGGIDYTVLRRSLILNDTGEALGWLRDLTQEDFDGDVGLTTYGMELATRSIVTDGDGRAGIYEGKTGNGEHPYYGEIVLLHTEYNEDTEEDEDGTDTPVSVLKSQAKRNYVGRDRPVTQVKVQENSRLQGRVADELMPMLFPGVHTRVKFADPNRGTISEIMRLSSMRVQETADGEDVSVRFTTAVGAEPIIEGGA